MKKTSKRILGIALAALLIAVALVGAGAAQTVIDLNVATHPANGEIYEGQSGSSQHSAYAADADIAYTISGNTIQFTKLNQTGPSTYSSEVMTLRAVANSGYAFKEWTVNGNAIATGTYPVNGSTLSAVFVHTHDDVTFGTAWNTGTSLPATAGNYYLTTDVTLTDTTWTVPTGTTNLCLNGHVIKRVGTTFGSVIKINSGNTLNLYDCDTTTKHYFTVGGETPTEKKAGLWVLDDTKSTSACYVTGGCIIGGTGSGFDSYTKGGGVNCVGGTFTMNGGNIVGNQAYNGGGVYCGGTFTMNGGNIVGNYPRLGTLYLENSAFTMNGGVIQYNLAMQNAGGVLVTGTSNMAVGGTANITGNTHTSDQNNLYLATGNMLTVNNGFTGSIGVLLQNGTGAFTNTCAADDVNKFSSDNEAYKVEYNTDHLELVPSTVHVTGVSLNKTTAKIAVDGTETLSAKVSPADATDKSVTWSSSNSAVATVSDGVVTGVAPGTATITVTTTDGNKTATCTVTVYALVTFDGNGGTGTMDPQEFTGVSQKLTENAFDNEGYSFGGWTTDTTVNPVYVDMQEIMVTEDTTLYAYWIEGEGSTEKVPADGGTVDIDEKSYKDGVVSSVTFKESPGSSSDNIVLVFTAESEEVKEEEIPDPDGLIIRYPFDINVYKNGNPYSGSVSAVVKFTVDKSAVSSPTGVELAHWTGEKWENRPTTYIPEDSDNYTFEATVDSFSPFAIVGPNPSHSGSSVTSFFGEKNGNDFTFDKAVVITKATLPGASSATVTNTSGAGWYNCNLTTDSITGNGILYFQVPLDVLKVKGYTINDVSLVGSKTTYLKSENGYAKYSAVITKGGALTIDFEEDATTTTAAEKVQEVVEQKQTATEQKQAAAEKVQETVEQKQTTTQTAAKTPFPILGILAGLGIAGFVALRRR